MVISKDGQGERRIGVIADCTSMETQIHINFVIHTTDVEGYLSSTRLQRYDQKYNGPDFNSLDERVQTSLTMYLQEFGLNEHLGAFVEIYSMDRD